MRNTEFIARLRPAFPALGTLGLTFLTCLGLIAALDMPRGDWALGAQELLAALRRWYAILFLFCILCLLVFALVFLLSLVRFLSGCGGQGRRGEDPQSRESAQAALAFSMAAALFIGGVLVFFLLSEDIWGLYQRAGEDLAQLQAGECRRGRGWIAPQTYAVPLPGPYGLRQPHLLTSYRLVEARAADSSTELLLPVGTSLPPGFDLPFEEERSLAWNREHTPMFLCFYTSYFHILAQAVPAAP